MTVGRITLSPLAMTSISAVSPGARRPSMPGRQGFVVPPRFYPAEGFPAGTRDLEFSKNRVSRDESGTSGGDVNNDRISYLLSQGDGDSPVAFRRRGNRRSHGAIRTKMLRSTGSLQTRSFGLRAENPRSRKTLKDHRTVSLGKSAKARVRTTVRANLSLETINVPNRYKSGSAHSRS